MKHETIEIITDTGETVMASAPVIISASRSTDIPAFYAKWFIERLNKGYVKWKNPFNGVESYVSFNKTKAIVFWSKNPAPLIPYFEYLDKKGLHYYIQYTLNDYEKEGLETKVPLLEKRIETFRQISEKIGPERVIWRFDPLILLPGQTCDDLIKKIYNLSKNLKGLTNKLIFSFVDIDSYKKVKENMVRDCRQFDENTISSAEFSEEQMNYIAKRLSDMRDYWKENGWKLEIATCGEKIDLDKHGISHNRCIDGELMKRIFSEDTEFINYLNYGKLEAHDENSSEQLSIFDSDVRVKKLSPEKMKDKGQRKGCGCMYSKDIGMYNTCPHGCAYCYANTSKEAALRNYKNSTSCEISETILFKQIK